jgi:hypothetical protein
LIAASFATTASAQRVVLDDSLSPVETRSVELAWEPAAVKRALASLLAGSPDAAPPMIGRIPNVEVTLDTREFVGQSARIYLSLPALISGLGSPADLELRWDVNGTFIPGSVRPAQSTLVFEGPIERPVTNAVFNFTLIVQSGADSDTFDVEPFYELEIIP